MGTITFNMGILQIGVLLYLCFKVAMAALLDGEILAPRKVSVVKTTLQSLFILLLLAVLGFFE